MASRAQLEQMAIAMESYSIISVEKEDPNGTSWHTATLLLSNSLKLPSPSRTSKPNITSLTKVGEAPAA